MPDVTPEGRIRAWRPDADAAVTTTDFMRILGGVARKD